MSGVAKLAKLPGQVIGAVRRNGVGNVLRFGGAFVARHGLQQTVRYVAMPAALRRKRLAELERELEEEPMRAHAAAPAGDFAEDWTVASSLMGRVAADRPEGPPSRHAPRVHVLHGEAAAPAEAGDDDWVVVLRNGDVADATLPARVAAAGAEPYVEVISFDMMFDGPSPERVSPVLQPGVDPWLARYADVGFGRYAFRARLLRGEPVEAYARLRGWLAERSLNDAHDRWAHLHEPLVHAALAPSDVAEARREAVARARADLGRGAGREGVSVVICTHNRGRLLRQLVRALGDERIVDIVVVANNTTSPPALETLDWVRSLPRAQVLVRDGPFNFSRLSNAGAALARGDRLLFLNDDIVPVSDDWLEPLLQPLRNADVGVTGPLLLYPDESVQHAGMFLGFHGNAGHNLRHVRLPEADYLFYGSLPREVSAVTGAVMMVRRDLFDALNGFDEMLPTFLQDVDLCLRARATGLAVVWTPFAELIHMESASMKEEGGAAFLHEQRARERTRFYTRWNGPFARDPFRSPAFALGDESQRTLARKPGAARG